MTFHLDSRYNTSRVRFCKYNFDGNDKLFIVDGIVSSSLQASLLPTEPAFYAL